MDVELSSILMKVLTITKKREIVSSVSQLIYENGIYKRIMQNVKNFFKLDWVDNLGEFEKFIDLEVNKENKH